MGQFLRRWRLEWRDHAPLRIHSAHHVRDDAILAACVHRLQDDQHGVLAFGVEQLLELYQLFLIRLDLLLCILFVVVVAVVLRGYVAEAESPSRNGQMSLMKC